MPAFIERLGASNLVIGLLPALHMLGLALPAILAANYTERKPRKLPMVLWITLMERLPYLLIAAAAFGLAVSRPQLALAITLACVLLMAVAGGVIMPAWMDVVAKVIPVRVRGRYFAVGNLIAGGGGAAATLLAGYLLTSYGFPDGYGYCFVCCFAVMVVSFVFLAAVREPAAPPRKERLGQLAYLRRLPGVIAADPAFARYLLARGIGVAATMGPAFFAVYALGSLGAAERDIAGYTFIVLLAHSLSTFVWGWLGDRFGLKSVALAGILCLGAGNLAALLAGSAAMLYPAFFLSGSYTSANNVSHQALLVEFAQAEDRPTYTGLGGLILSPLLLLAPLGGGWLADLAGHLPVFLAAVVFALVSAFILSYVVVGPRYGRSAQGGAG